MPDKENEWKNVADRFQELWNFPYCLGAIDGKHINFMAPRSSGSYYYNYKGHHSIVLLAVCDVEYRLLYVDVGVNGRISDGGVFRESTLKAAIDCNALNFPSDKCLFGQEQPVPYIFVADDAFPLNKRILKPYCSRGLTREKRIFNYRLSRARRVVENCFGILANRFRILLTCINLNPAKVEKIVLACCVLHNYLILKDRVNYIEIENVNYEKMGGLNVNQGANRCSELAVQVRDRYCHYFSNAGAVEWQDERCFV